MKTHTEQIDPLESVAMEPRTSSWNTSAGWTVTREQARELLFQIQEAPPLRKKIQSKENISNLSDLNDQKQNRTNMCHVAVFIWSERCYRAKPREQHRTGI